MPAHHLARIATRVPALRLLAVRPLRATPPSLPASAWLHPTRVPPRLLPHPPRATPPGAGAPPPPSSAASLLFSRADVVVFDCDAPGVITNVRLADAGLEGGTPGDLDRWLAANAPTPTEDAARLVAALVARGASVKLASSAPAQLVEPLARQLGLPPAAVLARPGAFAADGSDDEESAARVLVVDGDCGGLAAAVEEARAAGPLAVIVAVTAAADGSTSTPAPTIGADYQISLGGTGGDWPAASTGTLAAALPRRRVAVVGSGAWACAATKLIAANVIGCVDFDDAVTMWVHDEMVDTDNGPASLVDIINRRHQNVRYLPGVDLGNNVIAVRDVAAAISGASHIVFAVPHQFAPRVAAQMTGAVAPGAAVVSLVKGMRVTRDGPQLISELLERVPGVASAAVLSGPNVAEEVAQGSPTEASLGFAGDSRTAATWVRLFGGPAFHVDVIADRAGVEISGTLKNVVALAYGLSRGAGAGANTRATLLRAGALEMVELATRLRPTARPDTFLSAAGLADLVATCEGGRNARVGAELARRVLAGASPPGPATVDALEAELLGGQKLQGALTAAEVADVLQARGWEADFPLFAATAAVCAGTAAPDAVLACRRGG